MAQYRDIDLPSGVVLRVNGDLTIPSNNLSVTTGTISEGGTLLSAKYLGINAKAADSEKLDNLDSTQFMRSDADTATTGNLVISGVTKLAGAFYTGATAPTNTNRINFDGYLYATQLYDGAVRVALSTRSITAGSGLTGGGDLTADRTLSVSFGGNGSASTASKSDHDHNATYLGISAKAVDSELLDGINSTQFVRNDTANSIAGLVTITSGGLVVNSGGIDSGTTITYGVTATKGKLNYSGGTVILEATSTNTSVDIKSTGTGIVKINGNAVYHAGNFTPTQYVKNDTTSQQVTGDFSVVDNSTVYVGTGSGKSGSIVLKGAGVNAIQITGANAAKLSGVGIYMNASGNAEFIGTVTADKIVVASALMVSNLNSEFLAGKSELDFAKTASILETGGYGVQSGLTVIQQSPTPNMSVRITAGVAYTDTGRRYDIAQVDQSIVTASATYTRYDIIYVYGSKNAAGGASGALEGTIGYAQGTPASSPVDPSVPVGATKLARITINANQGTIQTANITSLTEWRHLSYDGAGFHVRRQPLSIESNITSDLATVTITKPIKGTSWAKSNTITAGQTSVTWTHNLGLGTSYVIALSSDSPNRHIYWSSKSTNSIVINIDDTTDVSVVVDAVITAV